ncbi:MAG: hypothetical protein QNJ22_19790 [Desulfosarcinaceae bacterium]|nr:hypothetical protein [Desulfosarcinaceae bacterium]
MSQQKMGTHYVREICQSFREIASKSSFSEVNDKLVALADEMEPIAGKLYFKTQKGTEEMTELAGELPDIISKLDECSDSAAAAALCDPFLEKIAQCVKAAKTMKVRMT